MNGSTTGPACCKHHLDEVLLNYLEDPHVTAWAGGDGLTVEEALCCYAEALASNQVPGRQELLTLHPELADELAHFFTEANPHPGPQPSSSETRRAERASVPVG
jgi:hypothetical protein